MGPLCGAALVVLAGVGLIAQSRALEDRHSRTRRPLSASDGRAGFRGHDMGAQRPAGSRILPTKVEQSPSAGATVPGALSPRNANYSIDANLDVPRQSLTGREVITWRNVTPNPTSEMRFHLYWNAWRNTQSTWLRERALADAPARRGWGEHDWGWTNITAVRLLGLGSAPPIDLTGARRYIAPDDGNLEDRTVMQVPLPAPVVPGQTVNVEIEWSARVPRPFSRTGAIGNYFFIAQWFPKIGVLEAGGWNCRQFHYSTEFFSDYGVYDVRMRVPSGWVVGATGREQSRRDNGDGTTTHRYLEADVHDFAWTTSPDFLVREARFEHPRLPASDMRLLLQPEHAGQADRYFEATRAALRYYGEWFGAYPYGHITIVDPAWQSGSGGMEYPTLFTGGTRWLAPSGVTQPESVTIHEAGHQFWYGIVGNNEFDHAWLDEGLNSFSDARVQAVAYTPNYLAQRFFGGFVPWVFEDIPLSRVYHDGLASYRRAATTDAEATPSWRYFPATGASITYSKTALWLHTLERYLGWPTLQRGMAAFFQRFQFRHPAPDDFFRAIEQAAGRDLAWFFDQVYRSSNAVDYGVASLTSVRKDVRGFVERGGKLTYVTREQPEPPVFTTTVVVRRYGDATLPVDVEVTFSNGEKLRENWTGRERWRAFTIERPARAVRAVVDPDRVILLDVNVTNNSAALDPAAPRAAAKWGMTWMVWFQDLLMTYSYFL
jgi:hypothetical protein